MSQARIQYEANPKHCAKCGKVLPYNKRFQQYCSRECKSSAQVLTEEERLASEAREKEYHRLYDQEHKEEHRISSLASYHRNKDKVRPVQNEYKKNNKEKIAAKDAEYRETHKEEKSQYDAERYKTRRPCAKCGKSFCSTDESVTLCAKCREDN